LQQKKLLIHAKKSVMFVRIMSSALQILASGMARRSGGEPRTGDSVAGALRAGSDRVQAVAGGHSSPHVTGEASK
jgi:hypothetical protein